MNEITNVCWQIGCLVSNEGQTLMVKVHPLLWVLFIFAVVAAYVAGVMAAKADDKRKEEEQDED